VPSAGTEPAISGIKLFQTYDLDRTATGVGDVNWTFMQISILAWQI